MKLIKKQLITALIFVAASAVISMAIVAAFAAMLKTQIKFISLWCYGVGAFVSVWTCIGLRKLVRQRSYFLVKAPDHSVLQDESALRPHEKSEGESELCPDKSYAFDENTHSGVNAYWVERIKSERYLGRFKAYLTLMPYLLFGAAIAIMIGIFYKDIQSRGASNYIGYATLCALLGSVAMTLLIYSYMAARAFKVCKHCGTVNAFICDNYSEHVSTTAYWHEQRSSVLPSSRGMTVYRRKVQSNGDRIQCHCAKCKNNALITEIYDADWHWL